MHLGGVPADNECLIEGVRVYVARFDKGEEGKLGVSLLAGRIENEIEPDPDKVQAVMSELIDEGIVVPTPSGEEDAVVETVDSDAVEEIAGPEITD